MGEGVRDSVEGGRREREKREGERERVGVLSYLCINQTIIQKRSQIS